MPGTAAIPCPEFGNGRAPRSHPRALMTHRSPLPDGLDGERFLARDARAAGSTSSRLRAGDLARPFWGVRSIRPDETLVDRCRSLALRLPPDACYSHSTAALLFGAPLPGRLETGA